MKIQSVNDQAFAAYGKVVKGFDFSSLLATLENCRLNILF